MTDKYEAPNKNEYGMESWLQIRTECGEQVMHLQARGINTANRDYGLAYQFRVPASLTEWLIEQKKRWFSLASPQQLYIPAYLMAYEDGHQLVIEGDTNFNLPEKIECDTMPTGVEYGAVVTLQPKSMLSNGLIDFCINNGCIINSPDNKMWVGTSVGEEE